MKFLWNKKDGGPESRVWMSGLEIKNLFSVIILRFEHGSREAYHSHAFNCVSWVLSGALVEKFFRGCAASHIASWLPIHTTREHCHKVSSIGRTWVVTLRGPWADTWREVLPGGRVVVLTHGRRVVL